jgi:hypothetical protein
MATAPVDYLRECFDYDSETGVLRWRVRPRSHFISDAAHRRFTTQFSGKEAGSLFSTGYRIVCVGPYGYIGAHRIALAMSSGHWSERVDHINCDPSDNRLCNLRACSHAENARNRKVNTKNRSGFKGVSKSVNSSGWVARIQHDKKQINLGSFATPELAHAAYCEAARRYHGQFANAG